MKVPCAGCGVQLHRYDDDDRECAECFELRQNNWGWVSVKHKPLKEGDLVDVWVHRAERGFEDLGHRVTEVFVLEDGRFRVSNTSEDLWQLNEGFKVTHWRAVPHRPKMD
jgi:hypothetical protein